MKFKRYYGGKTKSRSGLEERIKRDLDARGIKYEYETIKLKYTKLCCPNCETVLKQSTYTPDFVFKQSGSVYLLVEAKGRFTSPDRTKLKSVLRDNPGVNLRILFMRDTRITSTSRTTNSLWCKKNGFEYAIGEVIPQSWIDNKL